MQPAATAGPIVTIVIPTLRRPHRVEQAARSVFRQRGIAPNALEMVIVDNDPAASALETVERLSREAPFPVRYVAMERPGIANARNAGVSAASAPMIAFLDDDEDAPEDWLGRLIEAQRVYGADVVFGPVRARLPLSIERHRDYFETFFSRLGAEHDAGPIDTYYGCGNSLIVRAALPDPARPFAEERNHIGGEDDLLFAQMRGRKAIFVWAPEAWVWEEAEPDRLSLRYTLKRAFAYGQGPSSACAAAGDRKGIAFWMAIGTGQAMVYGTQAMLKRAIGADDWAATLDRAVRGLGKLLWFPPFKFHIYGREAAAAPTSQAPSGAVAAQEKLVGINR